jgi:hypothetical protein
LPKNGPKKTKYLGKAADMVEKAEAVEFYLYKLRLGVSLGRSKGIAVGEAILLLSTPRWLAQIAER